MRRRSLKYVLFRQLWDQLVHAATANAMSHTAPLSLQYLLVYIMCMSVSSRPAEVLYDLVHFLSSSLYMYVQKTTMQL